MVFLFFFFYIKCKCFANLAITVIHSSYSNNIRLSDVNSTALLHIEWFEVVCSSVSRQDVHESCGICRIYESSTRGQYSLYLNSSQDWDQSQRMMERWERRGRMMKGWERRDRMMERGERMMVGWERRDRIMKGFLSYLYYYYYYYYYSFYTLVHIAFHFCIHEMLDVQGYRPILALGQIDVRQDISQKRLSWHHYAGVMNTFSDLN